MKWMDCSGMDVRVHVLCNCLLRGNENNADSKFEQNKRINILNEVPVQICLIIFMFQYFCVSLITMQQIITHSHSWIVYIVSSTISWLFKIVTKKKYKNWLLFWWRWVFFFTPQCLLWWCRWLCHVPFPWKCLFCELTV